MADEEETEHVLGEVDIVENTVVEVGLPGFEPRSMPPEGTSIPS